MKAKLVVKRILVIAICLLIFTPILLILAVAAAEKFDRYQFHASFDKTPEKYTGLVPSYLEASKPRLLVDTTDSFGGGYWVVEMKLGDNAANSIIKDLKYLKKDKWNKTPITEAESGAREADFIEFIRYDKCGVCQQLDKDVRSKGGYYLTPEAPRTTRVGIVLVPSAKRIYYIESGN